MLKRGLKIQSIERPEWGIWYVMNKYDEGIWIIRGAAGDRTLNENEAKRFWKIIK